MFWLKLSFGCTSPSLGKTRRGRRKPRDYPPGLNKLCVCGVTGVATGVDTARAPGTQGVPKRSAVRVENVSGAGLMYSRWQVTAAYIEIGYQVVNKVGVIDRVVFGIETSIAHEYASRFWNPTGLQWCYRMRPILPKGVILSVSPWGIHRHESIGVLIRRLTALAGGCRRAKRTKRGLL